MKTAVESKEKLTVLYDGECPFCKRYVHMVRLSQNFDVHLIDARNDSDIKNYATQAQYDLDKGMLVEYRGSYYYGDKAVFLLSNLSTSSNFFNRLMKVLFAHEFIAAILYPIMAFFRRITLFFLQSELINHLPQQPPVKRFGFLHNHSLRDVIADPVVLSGLCVRLTAFCLLFTVCYSWKLWFPEERLLATVSMFSFGAFIPLWLSQMATIAVVGLCGCLVIFPHHIRRLGLILTGAMMLLVLQDELRWQPFIYMYCFVLFAASFMPQQPQKQDFTALRFMIIGIYFWAGFYKINLPFVFSIFPWFVQPLGLNNALVHYFSFAVPFLECLIAVFLFIPRFRAFGVVMATSMLIVVLCCLGPLGHNWGLIVWPWNVLLHALEALLFLYYRDPLFKKDTFKQPLLITTLVLFWFLPALGAFDRWGAHQSFMLYSGLPPGVEISFASREDLSFLPIETQAEVKEGNTILLNLITIYEYKLVFAPGLNGNDTIIKSAKGLCPHLLYPDQAKIKISHLPHMWSSDYDRVELKLCDKKDYQSVSSEM